LIPPATSIQQAAEIAAKSDAKSFLVGNDGVYSGLVTREQIENKLKAGDGNVPVARIATNNYAHTHPDHRLELVMERLAKNPGLLPVVSRSHVHRLEGVITPHSLVEFVQENWKDQGPPANNSQEPPPPAG